MNAFARPAAKSPLEQLYRLAPHPVGVFGHGGGQPLVYANPALLALFGEDLPRSFADIQGVMAGAGQAGIMCLDALEAGYSFTLPTRIQSPTRGDESVIVSITPIADQTLSVVSLIPVVAEAEAVGRGQSAASPRQRDSSLAEAVQAISDGFALWDRQNQLILCNDNFRRLAGQAAGACVTGMEYDRFVEAFCKASFGDREEAQDWQRALKSSCEQAGSSHEAERRDGSWVQISTRRSADGAMVMLMTDVTGRKSNEKALLHTVNQLEHSQLELKAQTTQLEQLTEELAEARDGAEQASRAKSEFLANMSHELRTPLNAIIGFAEVITSELFGEVGDERYREYGEDIRQSGAYLLDLINDILDLSKVEAGKYDLRPEPCSPSRLVAEAMSIVMLRADGGRVSLKRELPEDLPAVVCDQRAFKQVMLNLLSNAIKYTPEGGSVTIGVEVLEGGGGMRFSVTDSGVGIPAQDIPRLMQPFEQASNYDVVEGAVRHSTGLGLALTRSLVELHGGTLELQSEVGVGTCICFTLPKVMAR